MLRLSDDTTSPAPTRTGNNKHRKPKPKQTDDVQLKPGCDVLDFSFEGGWRRGWGEHTLGSEFVLPYFAVRISGLAMEDVGSAVLIGVCRTRNDPPQAPPAFGSDASCFGLVSSTRGTIMCTSDQNAVAMRGVTNGLIHTCVLSTESTIDRAHGTGTGFYQKTPVTVGVVCDLKPNTLRFYVDDKPVRITSDRAFPAIAPPTGLITDKPTLKPGHPFEWPIVQLHTYFPYVAIFRNKATFEFVDWQPPTDSAKQTMN